MPLVNCNSTRRSHLSPHISCGEWNHFIVFDTVCCGFLQVREVCLDAALGPFLANLNQNTSARHKIKKALQRYTRDQDADTVMRLS